MNSLQLNYFEPLVRRLESEASLSQHNSKVLGVLGADPNLGVTTVTRNAAVVAATRQNARVLLVDANIEAPKLHQLFAQPISPGLINVLTEGTGVFEAIRYYQHLNINLLTLGDVQRLHDGGIPSGRFAELIDTLRPSFDWVFIDLPAMSSRLLPWSLVRMIDAALFVIGPASDIKKSQESLQLLASNNIAVAGTVFNQAS